MSSPEGIESRVYFLTKKIWRHSLHIFPTTKGDTFPSLCLCSDEKSCSSSHGDPESELIPDHAEHHYELYRIREQKISEEWGSLSNAAEKWKNAKLRAGEIDLQSFWNHVVVTYYCFNRRGKSPLPALKFVCLNIGVLPCGSIYFLFASGARATLLTHFHNLEQRFP